MRMEIVAVAPVIALVILLAGAAGAQEPLVWVASPWEQVLRDTPPGPARAADLEAARNEFEAFRAVVRAGAQPLRGVTVVATPLQGPGAIPASSLILYREHYVEIAKPSYRSTAPPGWYPDALIPFVDPQTGADLKGAKYDAAPFGVEPGMNQAVWVDVRVPPDAQPGTYTGRLHVTAGGAPLGDVPLRLTVSKVALPDTIAMRSNFGGFGSGVAKHHGVEDGSPEYRAIEERYIDTLLEHRCVPSSLGAVWPQWTEGQGMDDRETGERLRHMVEDRHVNALALPFPWGDGPERCRAYLHDLAAYLREKGWLDLAYIYMQDEPNDADAYEVVRRQGALIHEADPGIKRLCTEQTVTSDPAWGDLYGAVDIWCPLFGLYDEPTARQRQALREEIWSYTALCQCAEQNPFWEIDFPPVSFRAPFWVSWHYGIKGFLYWSSVYWEDTTDVWTRPCFRDEYWGEGMLLYPGAEAGIAGPVPSIRLKLIREGMEDFEMMTLAAQAAGPDAVGRVVDGVGRAFTDWEHDPAKYQEARRALVRLIGGK